MDKLETPIMVALLVGLMVFLITHAQPTFLFTLACTVAVVAIALYRVVRT